MFGDYDPPRKSSVGYGGMLMEGVVGVIAIITAASLHPADVVDGGRLLVDLQL